MANEQYVWQELSHAAARPSNSHTHDSWRAAMQIDAPTERPLLAGVPAQTAFLLGMADAAAQAQLPVDILAFNISTWTSNADSTG